MATDAKRLPSQAIRVSMFQGHEDDWYAGSPSGAQHRPPAPGNACAVAWRPGSATGQDFRRPVGGPVPRRPGGFAPVGVVVSVNGCEQARCLLGGTLLQRRPIGALPSLEIQLSAFSSQFLAFSVTIVMCRRHDSTA